MASSAAAAAFADEDAKEKKAAVAAVLALALLGQGKTAEASEVAAGASALATSGQNAHLRLAAAVAGARVGAANGEAKEALQCLNTALADATRLGLVGAQLEARLALGQIELDAGRTESGRARLGALESDARSRGFALVARKAASAIAQENR